MILNFAGLSVMKAYDHFTFAEEGDKNDPKKVLDKIQAYCNAQQNEVLQSFKFWNIPWSSPFDMFLTELRIRAQNCN